MPTIASTIRHDRPIACLLATLCSLAVIAAPAEEFESLTQVAELAEAQVARQVPHPGPSVTLHAQPLDAHLHLARCAEPLHVNVVTFGASQGHLTAAVSCTAPRRWTVYVPVSVERDAQVLVLRHAVPAETTLRAEDVEREVHRLGAESGAWLDEAAQLAGRRTRRALPAGTVLSEDMFNAELVMRAGQEIWLVASSGGIDVRAAGRALQDGALASRIRAQNLSSGKSVQGIVAGPDILRVAE